MKEATQAKESHPISDCIATIEVRLLHLATTHFSLHHPVLTPSKARCKSTVLYLSDDHEVRAEAFEKCKATFILSSSFIS